MLERFLGRIRWKGRRGERKDRKEGGRAGRKKGRKELKEAQDRVGLGLGRIRQGRAPNA